MMISHRRLLFIAIAAAAGVLIVRTWLRPPAEQEVRDSLERLQTLVEIKGEEPVFQQLAKAKEISSFFTDNCRFEWRWKEEDHAVEIKGRKDLQEKAFAMRRSLKDLQLALRGINVKIQDDQATAEATVSALGSMPGIEGQFFDLHRVSIDLLKEEGRWLIARVTHLENLRGEPKS